MAEHDSPISLQGGGTLAKQIVTAEEGGHWPVPEGTILASGVRRTAALSVDVVIVTTILMVATRWQIMNAWNLTAKTILHVDDWKNLFYSCGYKGDYYWFIP